MVPYSHNSSSSVNDSMNLSLAFLPEHKHHFPRFTVLKNETLATES